MPATTPTSRLLPALLLLLTGAGAGCGHGEAEPYENLPQTLPSPTETGFTVEDGITPDDLFACLEEAGLPVAATDATPMGVEIPVENLEVEPLEGGPSPDAPQGADLWVFTSGDAAAENRVPITLSEDDTPASWVAGNVVVRLFHPPAEGDAQVQALRECLPA